MNLSKRLNVIASFVTPGSVLADIGTDHAYIPVYLIDNGIIQTALALDINEGPLLKATENIKKYGFEDKITVRLSDGLENLRPGEADSIIIAGMGGLLIKRILNDGREFIQTVREIILSPHREMEEVRRFLHQEGFRIDTEKMLVEDKKFYVIIKAVKGNEKYSNTVHYKYGFSLLVEKDPVLLNYLKSQKEKISKIIKKIEEQGTGQNAKKIQELEDELRYINEAFSYYS